MNNLEQNGWRKVSEWGQPDEETCRSEHVPDNHARIDGQVVRLEHFRNHKYEYEGAYGMGSFCGWVDDESDAYGRCADGFYRPLYVATPLDSEEEV